MLFPRGTHCGPYTINRHIASGEVSDVYEAIAHPRGRRALKIVRAADSLEALSQQRVVLEAETLAMIEHVNVVRFYDAGVHEGRVWIVIEFVEGADLRRVVSAAGGKLPIERAVKLIRQACEGLCSAHGQGIIHRDLKPENILVTDEDLVKVADFERAKLPKWGVKTTQAQRTATALYMAPDLMLPGKPTTLADVYSMGVILYELIAGQHPIVQGPASFADICKRQVQYGPPALHLVVPDVPTDFSLLVQRAMMKDPAKRCSMRELSDGLEIELQRRLAWRRKVARHIPMPNRDPAFAPTEAMPVWDDASSLASSSVSAVGSSSASSTVSSLGSLASSASGSAGAPDRAALPPPAPMSLPPTTLRTPSLPAPSLVVPPPSLRASSEAEAPRLSSPLGPSGRGSTGVPVESTAMRPGSAPRAARAAAVGGVVIALGAAVWWTAFGRAGGRPSVAAQPVVTASASAPIAASVRKPPVAAASASAVAPKASARRPAATAPRARPRSPSR